METLLELLNSIKEMSPELTSYLKERLQCKEIKKREVLLKPGQVCKNIYFIERGLLRCYYVDGRKEVCTWFMVENDVIVSVSSFFQQQASYEFIQALEDSVLHYISYQELQTAYRDYVEFNFTGRTLLEKYYLLSEERLFCIRNRTGIQKVEFLYKFYPHLVDRVDQQHLASYLDMSEEYFSTCKKSYLEMISRKKS